jgi:hypothetical protein
MTNLKLYTKLSELPLLQKVAAMKFIESLPSQSKSKVAKRISGKAKGLIEIKEGFDDPII